MRLRRAWESGTGVTGLPREHGRPIRYACMERDQSVSAYWTAFAQPMPDGAGSRGYEVVLSGLCLWHEFGDVHLILLEEKPYTEHCYSNSP
ncbi:hypothetical protein ACWEQC_36210 [Streptomyces shenzhenensis]